GGCGGGRPELDIRLAPDRSGRRERTPLVSKIFIRSGALSLALGAALAGPSSALAGPSWLAQQSLGLASSPNGTDLAMGSGGAVVGAYPVSQSGATVLGVTFKAAGAA